VQRLLKERGGGQPWLVRGEHGPEGWLDDIHHLTAEERILIAAFRSHGWSHPQIADELGRDRSTIWRETRRNATPYDGNYRSARAHERAVARRKRSRRNSHFGTNEFAAVEALLQKKWSPEQISGHLRSTGGLSISHETIYRHVWRDMGRGGTLHTHLRQALKQRRKRYGRYDSRGRLAGKRMIQERPAAVERRNRVGHWEIDTMMGEGQQGDCVVTLVERKTGYVLIGKLPCRTKEHAIRVIVALIHRHPGRFKTITFDNGTEFHCYRFIEAATGVRFYFATPHHAWERGTSENTNGLIRQ
jgi:IS30 family transposase